MVPQDDVQIFLQDFKLTRLERLEYCRSINELAVVHHVPDASCVSNV